MTTYTIIDEFADLGSSARISLLVERLGLDRIHNIPRVRSTTMTTDAIIDAVRDLDLGVDPTKGRHIILIDNGDVSCVLLRREASWNGALQEAVYQLCAMGGLRQAIDDGL